MFRDFKISKIRARYGKLTGRAHFTQPLGSANKKTRKAQLVPQLHTAQVGPAPYQIKVKLKVLTRASGNSIVTTK
jgi:hypothetical protein